MEQSEETTTPETKGEDPKVAETRDPASDIRETGGAAVSDFRETPVQSPQVTEELLTKMVNLCEKQSTTITELTNRLNQLEERHESLSEDYQQRKPISIRAEVMGMYDFSKNKEIMYSKIYESEKQRAREIMNGINLKFPRI